MQTFRKLPMQAPKQKENVANKAYQGKNGDKIASIMCGYFFPYTIFSRDLLITAVGGFMPVQMKNDIAPW